IPTPDSPLRRLDPRWKLAALALTGLAATTLRTLPAALGLFAGSLILVAVGRLPRQWYLTRIAALTSFLIFFVGLLPFVVDGGGASWHIGFLRVSALGLRLAALICLKTLSLVNLTLVLLTSA